MSVSTLKRATAILLSKAFERHGTNIRPCGRHRVFHSCIDVFQGKIYLYYNHDVIDINNNTLDTTTVVSIDMSEI